MRKVQIVYYLSYGGGHFEHPHLLEVSISSAGLYLRDVKQRLSSLRGRQMPSCFSWSYKRRYKGGYVWRDLESDDDLILPLRHSSQYVLIGCKLESSCIVQTPASASKMLYNSMVSLGDAPALMHPSEIQVAELPQRIMLESSSNPSLNVQDGGNNVVELGITLYKVRQDGPVADVATQTSEENQPAMPRSMIAPLLTHPKSFQSELPSPPPSVRAAGSVATTSKAGHMLSHHMPSPNAEDMKLSNEKILPLPCSTSSSSNLLSAHTASNSNSVPEFSHPKFSLNRLLGSGEDEILQKNGLVSPARIKHDSTYNVYFAKSASMPLSKSTLGDCNRDGLNCSPEFCATQDIKAASLGSSNTKSENVVSVCSSSSRFLHLVSCSRGLDVIHPTQRKSGLRQRTQSARKLIQQHNEDEGQTHVC